MNISYASEYKWNVFGTGMSCQIRLMFHQQEKFNHKETDMNSISLTGFTERISGLAGRLREKLTGNDSSDKSGTGACRNEDTVDIKNYNEASGSSASNRANNDATTDNREKTSPGESLPGTQHKGVPVNLFMSIEDSGDVSGNQSPGNNCSDIPALKPDSVVKSDGNHPIFEYRFDRKQTTFHQLQSVGVARKFEEEEIRELNAFARKRMKDFTYEDYKHEEENGELVSFTKPVIHNRYNKRSNMTVIEFGPVYTTAVPEALKGNGNEYVGLEIAKAFIEKQREFLLSDPVLSSQSSEIFGDLRKMPFKPASADLIVASCCNPFYGKNASRVIDDMAEVLKPGGEVVIVPFNLENDKYIDKSAVIMKTDAPSAKRGCSGSGRKV